MLFGKRMTPIIRASGDNVMNSAELKNSELKYHDR